MNDKKLPARSEIDPQYTWNKESVFADVNAWQQALERVKHDLEGLSQLQGHLSEGPEVLADGLEAVEDLYMRMLRCYVYASMSQSVDATNQAAVARHNQAMSLFGRVMGGLAFVDPELLSIGRETLRQWQEEDARLAEYNHYFDNLYRKQAHIRSAEVEQVLGLVRDPLSSAYTVYNQLTDADLQFKPAVDSQGEEYPVAQGTWGGYLFRPDRELRRTTYENYHDGYLAYKNALAANLLSSMKANVFESRVRRHQNTLQMALFENNIPTDVYESLIKTYRQHLPTWHRYWRVRRKALGVDKLYPYDIWAPLVDDPPRVSYDQALEWITAGLAPLGDEYVSALRQGTREQRWIDVYPNVGKTSGAFSSGTYGTHPFILMSFTDDVSSLGTLAHELGHSMHSYMTWKYQPFIYARYSLFAAEVASNFNQAMTRAYLLEQDLPKEVKIGVIEEAMDNFHRYFLIMPTLARFELAIHQRLENGEGLTADMMTELLAALFAEPYGDEMTMDEERVGIQWATFSHLYADYYVYQYATGISAANTLAQRVLNEGPEAAEAYLNFLKAGGSVYAIDALKMAGVDMTQPEPVEETFGVLAGLVDKLEELTS